MSFTFPGISSETSSDTSLGTSSGTSWRRVIGIDPGLRRTGWGVIEQRGHNLRHVQHGVICPDPALEMAQRLVLIHQELSGIIQRQQPGEAAVEQVFVSKNAAAALKLGQARGVALLAAAAAGLPVFEYAPNMIKKSVTGSGHAGKGQVQVMVGMLLPQAGAMSDDEADALAVAVTHAHMAQSAAAMQYNEVKTA